MRVVHDRFSQPSARTAPADVLTLIAYTHALCALGRFTLDEVRVALLRRGSEPKQQARTCSKLRSGYNHSNCMDQQVTPMSDLTPRQTQILRLVQRFISETGMPPTRAEIAR